MKKAHLFLIYVVLICTTLTVSYSKESKLYSDGNAIEHFSFFQEINKGAVPRDRLFYSVLENNKELTTKQLLKIYKKDIRTAHSDYLTNLKNMWFAILNPRINKEGTEEEKLYLINQQVNLENNLAYIGSFYNLLLSSKLIGEVQQEKIANAYFEKNLKVIAAVEWSNEEEKKNKETELVYSKRTFFLLLRNQK